MNEQWQELKETITEMRDNDGTGTQQEVCKFLVNYMEILEKQMQEPKTGHWIRWFEQKETEWYIENIPHCKCSECGTEYNSRSSQFVKYCYNCGAKMVEPRESEE